MAGIDKVVKRMTDIRNRDFFPIQFHHRKKSVLDEIQGKNPSKRDIRQNEIIVGLVRFELTASSSRTRRAPPALQPDMAEVTGIEPAYLAWKARALPLSYSRAIGEAGFEPAASASRTLRANQAALRPEELLL